MPRGNGKAGPPGCKSRHRERQVKVDYKTKVRHRTGSGLTGTRESRSNGSQPETLRWICHLRLPPLLEFLVCISCEWTIQERESDKNSDFEV